MIATSFDESTHALGRPHGMSEEECDPLCVCSTVTSDGHPIVISCWKMTHDEMAEFQRTGRVWLIVLGHTMPPVSLTSIKPFLANGRSTGCETDSDT